MSLLQVLRIVGRRSDVYFKMHTAGERLKLAYVVPAHLICLNRRQKSFLSHRLSFTDSLCCEEQTLLASSQATCMSASLSTDSAGGSTTNVIGDIVKSKETQEGKEETKEENKNTSADEDSQKNTKKKEDSWMSAKNGWKIGLISLTLGGVILFAEAMYFWGQPIIDEDGHEVEDEYSHLSTMKAYFMRTLKEIKLYKKAIEEPSMPKLLPDPLREPYYQPKYTLILELTDVLVHPDWTLNTGWRFKKRPYLDAFIRAVGSMFEVVIYTKEAVMTAHALVEKIDTQGYIPYRLYRDATRYTGGVHIKDLNCINRDLSKVIVVDVDSKALKFHPENAFILSKWSGDDEDRTLMDLASFLTTIATSNVDDVRTVLEYYGQFEDPLQAFRDNQKKLQEQQQDNTPSTHYKGLTGSLFKGFTRR